MKTKISYLFFFLLTISTACHAADNTERSRKEFVEKLLEEKLITVREGFSLRKSAELFLAVLEKDERKVLELLAQKADPKAAIRDRGTIIEHAMISGNSNIIMLLFLSIEKL